MSAGSDLAIGLFVGGKGSRLGGVKKGLLRAPDTGETLTERLLRLCRAALPNASIVLSGDATGYEALGLEALPDDPPGIGPLGGLNALLWHASRTGKRSVIALACDLPRPSQALLERLATFGDEGVSVAPRLDGIWQPLFARYDVNTGLAAVEATLAEDRRALMRVLERLNEGLVELALTAAERELLRDWDTPDDL